MPDLHAYDLVVLESPVMRALVEQRLEDAVRLSGAPLTPFFLAEAWLWQVRLAQVAQNPAAQHWLARAALATAGPDAGLVVGHIGFHGPPDAEGRVEVGYSVDPLLRRHGHARAMLRQVLTALAADPTVRIVRASIAPDNHPSSRTISGMGFEKVGEQWDDEDGLEFLYERTVGAQRG